MSGPQLIQSPIGYIFPFGCAEDAANGDPFGCVPAIRADEDYLWVLPSLHFLWASLSFSQERREGVGVKEDKPLPLSIGEGPYFESARGLLGRTWGLKAG